MKRLLLLTCWLCFTGMAFAQETLPLPRVGLLVQGGARIYMEEPAQAPFSGFLLYTARLRVQGSLDTRTTYVLQTDFTRSNVLLDARITYRLRPRIELSFGQFKAPFSAEALTSAANLDFIYRARVVSTLAPSRQVGAQIRLTGRRLQWSGGIFNGDGRYPAGNADRRLLYVARMENRPARGRPLHVGINGALASARRSRVGIDLRWQMPAWFISMEWIHARTDRGRTRGYQVSAGYGISRKAQVLARIDVLQEADASDEQLLLGLNLGQSRRLFAQINYIIPLRQSDFQHHYMLFRLQLNR